MARVKGGFPKIVGGMSNLSFYTIQGSEQVYVRVKGGPSANEIKTKPQFEKLRRNNTEWRACTIMGSNIRACYAPMKHLEDFPAIGTLNGIAKKIQQMDNESEHGKRCIYLSKHKDLILGFNFSNKQVFENVLRVPLSIDLKREDACARIHVPAIDTSFQLYNYRNLPYFRLYFCLSGINDMDMYFESKVRSSINFVTRDDERGVFISEWFPSQGVVEAKDIVLEYLNNKKLNNKTTLVLSVGLEFGQRSADGSLQGVKYAGCGKIMRIA